MAGKYIKFPFANMPSVFCYLSCLISKNAFQNHLFFELSKLESVILWRHYDVIGSFFKAFDDQFWKAPPFFFPTWGRNLMYVLWFKSYGRSKWGHFRCKKCSLSLSAYICIYIYTRTLKNDKHPRFWRFQVVITTSFFIRLTWNFGCCLSMI